MESVKYQTPSGPIGNFGLAAVEPERPIRAAGIVGQEGIDHDCRGIARQFQAQPVMETGLGKHDHGVRQVLEKTARADLEAAVESDPTYPDARVFRASQRLVDGDANGASQDLVALDQLAAPPIVGDLLAATRLRERVAAALIDGGGLLAALDLLDSGLAADPAAAGLLAERGWLLARTGEPELVEIGVTTLDEAVAADPLHPHALAYRAVVRSVLLGDSAGATADATEFVSLPDQPPELTALLESEGLLE